MSDPLEFYKNHRGGSGAVIVVFAIDNSGHERVAVFGSIETATEWMLKNQETYDCVVAPYIVDDPDYGNVRQQ